MPIYPKANRDAQWFQDDYAGDRINPNVLVLHTTEGSSWPSYSGGASAPHLTILPDRKRKRLHVRQHFDSTRSARALQNDAGGVETNTLNAFQIELVGTCDKATAERYGVMYWPNAPDWALRELARVVAWLHRVHPDFPIRDEGKVWLPYPRSYGQTRARMSYAEWRNAYGIVGHQHVPENDHGDPGDFPVDRLVKFAKGETPDGPGGNDPKPTRVQRARRLLWRALKDAKSHDYDRRARKIRKARRVLPKD